MPRKAATPARDHPAKAPNSREVSRDIGNLVLKIKTMGVATHAQKVNFIIAVSNDWIKERKPAADFRLYMQMLFGENWKALVQEARDVGHARRKGEFAARQQVDYYSRLGQEVPGAAA